MTHGSLFSGIGGCDLAAQWMGWENIFHCEWNPFGQKVLKYYWPQAISYEDITKTDFTVHRGQIDILTGGFPCQPYSLAGLRKGKEDERHLWPEMLRAVREIKPRWIVGENVLGLVGWDDGLVFEEVQTDLEAEGYEVQPYVLPAAAVGAPHRRDRVWFVAYRADAGTEDMRQERQDSVYGFGSTSNASGNGGSRRPTTCDWEKENSSFWPDIQQQASGSGVFGAVADASGDRRKREWTGSEAENGKEESRDPWQLEGRFEGLYREGDVADTENLRYERSGHTWEGRTGSKNRDFNNEHSERERCEEFDSSTLSSSSGFSSGGHFESYGRDASDSNGFRLRGESNGLRKPRLANKESPSNYWDNFPTQPPVRNGNDGFSTESLRQRIRKDCMGILSKKEIDKIISEANTEWRNESIKAGGNAIVPQVIHQIFKAIEKYESL